MATVEPKKTNPFELRVQKQKHSVLGQKVKGTSGRVVAARSKSIEIRRETLGVELAQENRANRFIDRRFGEGDEDVAPDDKMLMRFQKERQKQLQKRSKFNLEDDEYEDDEMALTHLGKPIHEIDDFKEEIPEDSDEDITQDMVSDFHFGGGFRPKKEGDSAEDSQPSKPKTKKEVMMEIIAKSKMYKAERQREKAADLDMTEELDEEFNQIKSLLSISKKEKDKQQPIIRTDYDRLTRELADEIRAHATERLKTPQEIALAERERLQQAEKKRLERMRGEASDDESSDEDSKKEKIKSSSFWRCRHFRRKFYS